MFIAFTHTVRRYHPLNREMHVENVMENLDRFFDVWERVLPRNFGDVLAAFVFVSFVAWIVV